MKGREKKRKEGREDRKDTCRVVEGRKIRGRLNTSSCLPCPIEQPASYFVLQSPEPHSWEPQAGPV